MSIQILNKTYGDYSYGIQKALDKFSELKNNQNAYFLDEKEIHFQVKSYQNCDEFQIQVAKNKIVITGNSIIAFIAAINELKQQNHQGKIQNKKHSLAFQTRFYKFETVMEMPGGIGNNPRHKKLLVTKLTPEYLHSHFQKISEMGFNAVVMYCWYHPFEYFLDYKGFEHGIEKKTKALRAKNHQAVKQFFQIAKMYGLKTFLHHYVSHFSQALADHLKLGIKLGGTRLANYDHPEIVKYNKYIYKRTFQTIPELDGMFFNFESAPNNYDLVEKTFIPAVKELRIKPNMYIRLWNISNIDGIKNLFKKYNGPKGLMHKSHDTSDVYYHPTADERVKYWRKEIPNVEFAFSMGPCHNCATNLSYKVWTDPEYIHQLMSDMQKKGATSVSFQATVDLLTDFTDDKKLFDEMHHQHSKANIGHLLAFEDYINHRKPKVSEWAKRFAAVHQISDKAAENLFHALTLASQVILYPKWQFCSGSYQEGHLYYARNSFYQDPFFYHCMADQNELYRIKYNMTMGCWLKRDKPVKALPNHTQRIIDYVNPKVKKTSLNPLLLSKKIKDTSAAAKKFLTNYQKLAGKKVDKALLEKLQLNINWGERAWREIQVAINLYSCYFAKTKNEFFKSLKQTEKCLADIIKNVDIKKSDQFLNMNGSGPFQPQVDINYIREIISNEKADFPWLALKHYVESHRVFNEIMRYSRPYASIRNEVIDHNRKLLEASLNEANQAILKLHETKHSIYRSNVISWRHYVQAQIDELLPPALTAYDDKNPLDQNNFKKFTHDQCYRYGENCWEDFSSFFTHKNYFRQDNIDFKVSQTKIGLKITLREHGIDWDQRKQIWDKNIGTLNQTGFLQLYIDTNHSKGLISHYTLFFYGKGGTEKIIATNSKFKHLATRNAPLKDVNTHFSNTNTNWTCEIVIPWKKLGKKPKAKEVWRLNAYSNPEVKLNHRGIWCQGYEMKGDYTRLGNVYFN